MRTLIIARRASIVNKRDYARYLLKAFSQRRPWRNKIVFICKLLLAQHLLLNAVNSFTRLVMAEGV